MIAAGAVAVILWTMGDIKLEARLCPDRLELPVCLLRHRNFLKEQSLIDKPAIRSAGFGVPQP